MKIQVRFFSALTLIALALSNNNALAAEKISKVDLSPVFAGMEKDCASTNPKFQALLAWLTTYTGKPPAVSKAGAEMRSVIGSGQIKVKDEGDSWTLVVPVAGASYRGAALVNVERWVGKDNGINGISLTFADAPAVVSNSIGKVKSGTGNEEQVQPQLLQEDKTARAVLMCDFSN